MSRFDYTVYARASARALEDLGSLIEQRDGHSDLQDIYQRLESAIGGLFDTITELAASEARLRKQGTTLLAARVQADLERQHYQQLFEGSPDGYLVTDAHGMIREGNFAAAMMLQTSAHFLVNKPLASFIAVPMRPAFRRMVNSMRLSDHPEIHEWEFKPRQKAPVKVAVTVSAARDEFGNVLAIRWLLRDISAQVRSREHLERLSRQNELLLSSVGEGIFGVGPAGNTTFINPAGARMLGWTEQEFVGRTVDELLSPRRRSPVAEAGPATLHTTLLDGIVRISEEETFLCRDGHRIPVEYITTPILEGDDIVGMVVAFRNITSRLEWRNRVDMMQQVLEIRVAERTVDLEKANRDLEKVNRELEKVSRQKDLLLRREQAARTEAENANRVKDDFMAIVSHELRTPLTTIKTFTDLMLRNPVDEVESREYLSVISMECDRQISLVQNVLDVAFIESRGFSLAIERVDLEELVRSCLPPHLRAAASAGQEIVVDIPTGLGPVRGDGFALRRIVSNLLENAVKYTTPGGKITVTVTEGKGVLNLHVGDTGPGIAKADQARIFEKYDRACDSSGLHEVETARGVGLGLYLARLFAERIGGRIDLQSIPGEGSRFTLSLIRWVTGAELENNSEAYSHERTSAGR